MTVSLEGVYIKVYNININTNSTSAHKRPFSALNVLSKSNYAEQMMDKHRQYVVIHISLKTEFNLY